MPPPPSPHHIPHLFFFPFLLQPPSSLTLQHQPRRYPLQPPPRDRHNRHHRPRRTRSAYPIPPRTGSVGVAEETDEVEAREQGERRGQLDAAVVDGAPLLQQEGVSGWGLRMGTGTGDVEEGGDDDTVDGEE